MKVKLDSIRKHETVVQQMTSPTFSRRREQMAQEPGTGTHVAFNICRDTNHMTRCLKYVFLDLPDFKYVSKFITLQKQINIQKHYLMLLKKPAELEHMYEYDYTFILQFLLSSAHDHYKSKGLFQGTLGMRLGIRQSLIKHYTQREV